MAVRELSPDALCRRCDPNQLGFETTESLEPLGEAIGQARAVDAIRFALGIAHPGYNLFAMGPAEVDKRAVVRTFLEESAASKPSPNDVCYVSDFDAAHKPRAIRLPSGKGRALEREIAALIEKMRTALPAAFASKELNDRKQSIEDELKARQEREFEELKAHAKSQSIGLVRTPVGFALAPMRGDEVLEPEEFAKLPEEQRKKLEHDLQELHASLHAFIREGSRLEEEARAKVKALIHDVAMAAAGHQVDELRARWKEHPSVIAHLDALQRDVLENVDDFLKGGEPQALEAAMGLDQRTRFRRYAVNLLVEHDGTKGAPVVIEDRPTFQNLVGRIEHTSQFGTLHTDFTLLKAGSLHRANGGYLMIDALDLLMQPYAWDGLKRALLTREIRMETLGQSVGLISTVSLEPEPIPLDLKVVLVGERRLYHVLDQVDPDFRLLFKVVADFEETMDRGPESATLLARLIAKIVRDEKLRHFHRDGVARLIDHAARMTEDAEKLSTHTQTFADLAREADHFAREAQHDVVRGVDVQRAIEARDRRLERVEDLVLDEVKRGLLIVETRGEKVGQVNGLSVIDLGRHAFGRPTRITAKVRLGKGEVIDIEREVELGGPIHSKGVLILAGYLGARFAREEPLSLSATIVFEQSYGMVEGDSASSTELYALLSALAEAPIKQSLAVTGSVDQNGRVQPVGGLSEKIEGFFHACRAQGLTGEQGVVIPAINAPQLMLSQEVVNAVREKMFRVFSVETIDEGIALLTGLPAETVNQRVEARLVALAERRRALANGERR